LWSQALPTTGAVAARMNSSMRNAECPAVGPINSNETVHEGGARYALLGDSLGGSPTATRVARALLSTSLP